MEELKAKCMALNTAELQHLMNYLQKERDDLLMFISFTKEYFTMSEKDFKAFKEFVLYGDQGISFTDILGETINQLIKEEEEKH